jgi:hypothetical protein
MEIMIGDTAAWDGSGSGEGKPKARVEVPKHGPECLHTPVRSLGAAIRRPISAVTQARTFCINSSVVHKLLVLSVSSYISPPQEHPWGYPINMLDVPRQMTLIGESSLISNFTDGELTRVQ